MQGRDLRNPTLLKSKCALSTPRRLVVLAPHPDDVAYSVGGFVAQFRQGLDWTIITVFGRSVYAPGFPASTDELVISRVRDEEDNRYASSVRAKRLRLGFADASVLGHSAASEITDNFVDERFEVVCSAINEALIQLSPDLILAPLALGRHIDHRIVFEAVLRSTQSLCSTVLYYEDMPYAGMLGKAELLKQVTVRLGNGVAPLIVDITKTFAKKCDALSFYPSQKSANDQSILINHALSVYPEEAEYAERLWFSNS